MSSLRLTKEFVSQMTELIPNFTETLARSMNMTIKELIEYIESGVSNNTELRTGFPGLKTEDRVKALNHSQVKYNETNLLTEVNDNALPIGDYVFASLYSDGDWNDPWGVGFISDMRGEYFRIASSLHPLRFKYAVKISQKVGDRILNDYPKLEGTSFDQSTKEEIFEDS